MTDCKITDITTKISGITTSLVGENIISDDMTVGVCYLDSPTIDQISSHDIDIVEKDFCSTGIALQDNAFGQPWTFRMYMVIRNECIGTIDLYTMASLDP